MKNIKIEKIDLSDFLWGEKDKYNFNNPAPESVSNLSTALSMYRGEILDSLITSLENVKVRAEDVMKNGTADYDEKGNDIIIPFEKWEDGLWNDYAITFTKGGIPDKPIDWGNGDSYVECRSFADITILNTGPHHKPYETDIYYSTPEVIQVLKQWREYLIKWKKEHPETIEEIEKILEDIHRGVKEGYFNKDESIDNHYKAELLKKIFNNTVVTYNDIIKKTEDLKEKKKYFDKYQKEVLDKVKKENEDKDEEQNTENSKENKLKFFFKKLFSKD